MVWKVFARKQKEVVDKFQDAFAGFSISSRVFEGFPYVEVPPETYYHLKNHLKVGSITKNKQNKVYKFHEDFVGFSIFPRVPECFTGTEVFLPHLMIHESMKNPLPQLISPKLKHRWLMMHVPACTSLPQSRMFLPISVNMRLSRNLHRFIMKHRKRRKWWSEMEGVRNRWKKTLISRKVFANYVRNL